MNNRARNKYKEDENFRLRVLGYSKKYNLRKKLELHSDGLRHEVCENCCEDYSYSIRKGKPRKYCNRIECMRDRGRQVYHKYVSISENRKKVNEICKKAHRKYYKKNRKLENERNTNRRNKNLKKERLRDKKRHEKDKREFLIKNGLPKDYIHEFKYEKMMKLILDKIFPNDLSIDNKRFILVNNKIRQTYPFKKSNFELDRFYPNLKIAFEFDGEQHKRFIPYFHRSKEDF